MGSIQHEVTLKLDADAAWAALRLVKHADKLFAGVVTAAAMDGDVRTVTFANGMVVRERIVDLDDRLRRLVYSAFEGTPMTHHNASMQIIPEGDGQCRFVWIADFLPDDFGQAMQPLMEQGAQALKSNLEADAARLERMVQ